MSNSSLTLHNIQVLRALAAIMVVMHHAFPHYEAMGGELVWLRNISNWGFVGVDIFFIISGFIMAYTTFSKPRGLNSARRFFKHRLIRIYLGYWPFFFVMLFIVWGKNSQHLATLDIVNSFLLTNTNMFDLVLPVSWSLSYELYFYILFLLTFLFSIKQLYTIMPIFITFILTLVLYSFFSINLAENFFYSHFLLEFFAGVLLYMYRGYLSKFYLLPVSLLLIIIAYWYGIHTESKNGLLRILTFGSAAFFVVQTALILEGKNIYPKIRLFERLGDASYTLYLSHLIILELFYFTGLRNVFTSQYTFIPLMGFIIILIICIVFSLMYYRLIERPLYRKVVSL